MRKEQIFKNYYAKTKEEIIEEFKSHYNYYKTNNDEENQLKKHKEKYLKLCEKFLAKLEKLNLPKLTDDWWCYWYVLKNDAIDLSLSFCSELVVENNEVSEATFSDEYILLSVKCNYMTVAEYAKLYNITEVTVRQWIRRGKIRSAKKQGRDWLIPDIADKPTRGYEDVTYYWKNLTPQIIEKFHFLNGYNSIFIFQNKDDKRLYDVILNNYKTGIKNKVQISNSKREKLELELISSGLVDVEESKIFHA